MRRILVYSLASLLLLVILTVLLEYCVALNYFALKNLWWEFNTKFLFWNDTTFAFAYRSNAARTESTLLIALIFGVTGFLAARCANSAGFPRAIQFALVSVLAWCLISWGLLMPAIESYAPSRFLSRLFAPGIGLGELLIIALAQMAIVIGIFCCRRISVDVRFTSWDILVVSSCIAFFFSSELLEVFSKSD